MQNFIAQYKTYFLNKRFVINVLISFALLSLAIYINFYAAAFATRNVSNAVTDAILDNIRVYDVDGFFVYGPFVMWFFVVMLGLFDVKKFPFGLKAIALFIVIRSVFITLTHIGPFPTQVTIDYSSHWVKEFYSGGDLFFSAHTGLPFLLALIFHKNKILKIIFIATSIFFGAIVLMAHLHYSIDVLSAFFITYAIYHLAIYIFKRDFDLFNNGLPTKNTAES